MVPPMVGSEADSLDGRWQRLFTIAGVAAACTAVFIVVQIVVYAVWPPPATAIEHLALMRDRPLLGLLSLDLLYVIDNVLLIPILLAAGEVMLAVNVGTAYHVSLILGSVALVVISVVMLRSGSFGRPTAVLGILANVLAFGLYLPGVGIYVLLFSTVLLLGWYVLIATAFLRLGRGSASAGVVRGRAPRA